MAQRGKPPVGRAANPRMQAMSVFSLGVSEQTPAAVVSRIRVAIELGMIPDGEPLPKEQVLASTLGVSVFTLREGLSRLRSDGYVVTRVGRGGGTFVSHAGKQAMQPRTDLAEISSASLRDLGDWRAVLAAESANLAARRASASQLARLGNLVSQVRLPDDLTARRAAGVFRLELAAAAQSVKLSAETLRFHEEDGRVFDIPYGSLEFRNRSADGLAPRC
jgi:GntR family transcriptional repressor for pyruvate dehydrogenase complex